MIRRSPPPRGGLILLTLLTVLLASVFLKPGIALDGISYFSYLRSAVHDGDLVLLDEFSTLGVARADFNLTPEGQVRNVFPIGSAVLWLPFYAVGHTVSLAAAKLTGSDPVNGYSILHVFFVYVATACFGLAALVLSARFAVGVTNPLPAWHAAIAVWLGSPFLYYQFIEGDYSHVPAALTVALFVIIWHRTRGHRSLPAHLLLGFLAGMVAMVRWQHVLVLVLPLSDAVIRLWHRRLQAAPEARERPSHPAAPLLVFTAGFIAGAAPQLAYWRIALGEWVAIPQGTGFLVWKRPEIIGTLFSSFHGLFGWHPLLLLAVVGLLILCWQRPGLGLPLVLLFALETYVNSIVWDWEAGVSFGGRRFVGLTVLFVLGLAEIYRRVGAAVSGFITVAAALLNLLLLYEFHFGLISRRWFVSFGEIFSQHARHVQHLDQVIGAFASDHLLRLWPGSAWLVLGSGLLFVLATVLILAAPRRWSPRVLGGLTLLLLVSESTYVRAAIRSRPAPTSAVRDGDYALIDFRWYENGHYQLDPFRPGYPGHRHFLGLGGASLAWGSIPFAILDPLAKPLANASAITTCHLVDTVIEVPLRQEPARALWLAVDGGALTTHSGLAAGRLEITYEDGTFTGRDLIAGKDVWDYWHTPPAECILWQGSPPSDLTVVRLAADSTRTPRGLRIRSAPASTVRGPGFTVFAITQERVGADPAPISISGAANTDFMQDPFRPEFAANHFPHLSPGTYHWQGVPYLILDVDRRTGRGTVITTAWQEHMRIKLPLVESLTERVDLVVDGAGLRDLPHLYVGDLLIHYADGPPAVVHVQSTVNVWDYHEDPDSAALVWRGSPIETLSIIRIGTDPTRPVRSLELRSAGTRGNNGIVAGFAVFAITQKLAGTGSHATRSSSDQPPS
jgi:hypothetical protein